MHEKDDSGIVVENYGSVVQSAIFIVIDIFHSANADESASVY